MAMITDADKPTQVDPTEVLLAACRVLPAQLEEWAEQLGQVALSRGRLADALIRTSQQFQALLEQVERSR